MSDLADPFLAMAKRIGAIEQDEFAGAVVIVPPGGDPIEFMLSDVAPNAAAFWAIAKSRVDVRTQEIINDEERQRQQNLAYGRR